MIISLKKAREKQLQKESAYISNAYETMEECACAKCRAGPIISIVNDDDHFVAQSEGMFDFLGWDEEELTGKTFWDVTHKNWWPTSAWASREVRKTGTMEFSKYYTHRNGAILPAHVTGYLSYQRGERVIVGFVRPMCRRLVEKMHLRNLQVYPHLVGAK